MLSAGTGLAAAAVATAGATETGLAAWEEAPVEDWAGALEVGVGVGTAADTDGVGP